MNFRIRSDPATGERYMAVPSKGRALLLDPQINKGTAFTARERWELDLEGLLPPAVCTIEDQLLRTYENYCAKKSDLERYIYLIALQDRNETLFYRLLHTHIDQMLPVVYTPTVGEACCKFSHLYRRARGLYISYDDRKIIERVLAKYRETQPQVIVVTDGERILGLGDQGAGGMGIPIGKLCLYTLCAGIRPYRTLPVMLDAGTDNAVRLDDPLYLGLRRERVRGAEYQAFVDAFVAAVRQVFPGVLLQWEDFLKGNAIHQLQRFRDELCSFNDDIQGTGAVVLAGLLAASRITGDPLESQRLLIAGAGAAALGVADLFVAALAERGVPRAAARRQVWLVDSRGLVATDRPGLEAFKAAYARGPEELGGLPHMPGEGIDLAQAVRLVRPTVLIGASGMPGLFDQVVVERMARFNQRPVLLPLSNPTSRCECEPAEAIAWSEGRALVATGSPFLPVIHQCRKHRIGQANNALVFPGIGLGLTLARARRVTDEMFLDAAAVLAAQVTDEDLRQGALYPDLVRIRDVSAAIACAVARRAVAQGLAEAELEQDLEQQVRRAMWFPDYLPLRHEPL